MEKQKLSSCEQKIQPQNALKTFWNVVLQLKMFFISFPPFAVVDFSLTAFPWPHYLCTCVSWAATHSTVSPPAIVAFKKLLTGFGSLYLLKWRSPCRLCRNTVGTCRLSLSLFKHAYRHNPAITAQSSPPILLSQPFPHGCRKEWVHNLTWSWFWGSEVLTIHFLQVSKFL